MSQLRWVAFGLLIASLIPAGLSIPAFRRSRHAPYYILRRNALRRATRCVLVMFVMQAVAVLLLIACPRLAAVVSTTPTAAPTAMPTSTPVWAAAPTSTPLPTIMPTATPTHGPTATPPYIPTPTPTEPVPTESSPLPSPAPEGAHIEPWRLALERDDSGWPVNPGNEFPPGEHTMYFFFRYQGMENGIVTTFAWYKDGEFIDFCSDTWPWGLVEGRKWGDRGMTSYFCRLPEGWQPGAYEIHVSLDDELQGVAQFVITGE